MEWLAPRKWSPLALTGHMLFARTEAYITDGPWRVPRALARPKPPSPASLVGSGRQQPRSPTWLHGCRERAQTRAARALARQLVCRVDDWPFGDGQCQCANLLLAN